MQDYDNLEIIVSDNFSQDNTREIVEGYNDPRVSYINPGRRISMSSNFEFGLSHATGDYVGFIGDDDGLMPGAIVDLNDFIGETKAEAVSWQLPIYGWGNLSTGARNTLEIPFNTKTKQVDPFLLLQKVLMFNSRPPLHYLDLVRLYHGFVRRDAILKIKALTGKFFNSICPDVYAGVAISCVLRNFWKLANPLSMSGSSGYSTSALGGVSNVVEEFFAENDTEFHPNLKVARSMALYTAEGFLNARQIVPEAKGLDINIAGLIDQMMREGVSLPADLYGQVVVSVRHIGEVYQLQQAAEAAIAENPNVPLRSDFMLTGYNFRVGSLILKLDGKKITNVYDATLACRKLRENSSIGKLALQSGRFALSAIHNYGLRNTIRKILPGNR